MTDTGSLATAPLAFVFIDISSLPRQRRLFEDVLGLRVIENQFHPPHEHHGLVKYDAGGTILSINLFAGGRLRHDDSDGLTLVCRTRLDEAALRGLDAYGRRDGRAFTDADGHHYLFTAEPPRDPNLAIEVARVWLAVADLDESVAFYRDVLGLSLLGFGATTARFATGTLDLVLEQRTRAVDGRPIRYSASLLVFYTGDVEAAERELIGRGLVSRGVAFSDIGGTARFSDPSGHVFCLYQPSAESLTWGSAGKVMELMTGGAAAHR